LVIRFEIIKPLSCLVRYPSVSLGPTLCKNEKVKQYIRKKIHKPTALRFWVKSGVIPLYVWPISHSYKIFPVMTHWIFSTSSIRVEGSCRRDGDLSHL